jgi:hypothetical protein
MSKGPGHIARLILSLIETEPDGAWLVSDICKLAYGVERVEKKHRVAVARTLRTMKLPGTWHTERGGSEYCLFDVCSAESILRLKWRSIYPDFSFARFKRDCHYQEQPAAERAEKARRYRDASPVEKIDMQVHGLRTLAAISSGADTLKRIAQQIAELEQERKALA